MQAEPATSLRNVLMKAAAFPALVGLLIFVASLLGNPDHSVQAIASALITSCVLAALASVPFLLFAWLRWQTSRSGSALGEFEQRVKPSNFRRGHQR